PVASSHSHVHSEPNYVYSANPPSPALSRHSTHSMSPALSDRSSSGSWGSPSQARSIGLAASPSPSSGFSRQSSPLFGADGFPLTDAGFPYMPAPNLDDVLGQRAALGPARVDLAPLSSLRSHPYRRCPADDRALRLLGPGAR
ncbi:hypothetical protein EVJ58_g8461, partial [Rhodofomes roseus]